MKYNLLKIIGWLVIPGLSILLGIQNNPLTNNYSDLQTDMVYSKVFLLLCVVMGAYLFYTLYYLMRKRKLNKFYFLALVCSLILFLLGNFLPYQPGGQDILSARHVDLVLLAIGIYVILFLRYLSAAYYSFSWQKNYLIVFLLGSAGILFYFQRVNSLLEVWTAIGLSILLERLCNEEKSFDI